MPGRVLPVRGKGRARLQNTDHVPWNDVPLSGPIMRTSGRHERGLSVPTTSLPENPSLEHLKNQAKLVRDLIRAGDPGGLSMVDEFHPRLNSADLDETNRDRFKTADAQLIVARLYRFSSWNRLREHLAFVESHSFTPGDGQTADPDPANGVHPKGVPLLRERTGQDRRIESRRPTVCSTPTHQ